MIGGVSVKGKIIIVPSQLKMQILGQLHSNHMGIEKMRLLVCKSVYLVNLNADIENRIKHCSTHLGYQNMQLQEKTIPHKILSKPWEVLGADIFMVGDETLLCIVDYYTKFPVVKKVESMLAEDLI